MHMLSRKDLNSAELETVKVHLKKIDDGCYRNKNWIYS